MPFPVIDSELEVTDASLSHTAYHGDSFNPECTQLVRIGNDLYAIYDTDETHVWHRRLNLDTYTFATAIQVDSTSFNYSYHGRPSIARDGSGALHTISQNIDSYNGTYTNAYTASPNWRRLPSPPTTTNATAAGGILPCRILNSSANFTTSAPLLWDISHAYDYFSGTCYLVGDGAWYHPIDGRPNIGDPRVLYRITSGGTVEGPYCITETVAKAPTSSEVSALGGNPADFASGYLFTKGDIKITNDGAGNATLHVMWQIRNTWEYPTSTPVEWNYNLYYAKSRDGGRTWSPVDGSCTVSVLDTLGSEHPHITYNDSRFLAYTGDLQQDTSRGFAIDVNGYPVCIIMPPKSGQDSKKVLGSMDFGQSPTCDLKFVRWTGSAWSTGTVDTSASYAFYRPKLVIDPNNRWWIWAGSGSSSIRYRYSDNSGTTWTSWTTAGSGRSENFRVAVYEDAIDPSYIYLMYSDDSTSKLYLRRVQLGNFARTTSSTPAIQRTIDHKPGSGSPSITKAPSAPRIGQTFTQLVRQIGKLNNQQKPPRPGVIPKPLKKNPFK